ncbi:MAG: hypothetical protein V7K86_11195 [Nostoc sp.]|uniref:hypothetical protein n=1 Tax=Nostoc sp. TaxID=1180 RepID=UPI002FF537D8
MISDRSLFLEDAWRSPHLILRGKERLHTLIAWSSHNQALSYLNQSLEVEKVHTMQQVVQD